MINIGDRYEQTAVVTDANTAAALGSGALRVFGTPYLVSMMENAALKYMAENIPEDKSTVGTIVHVNHNSATPLGMTVKVTVEVTAISENGKMVDFKMEASDDAGPIADGYHQRAIVSTERFLARAEAKASLQA